MKGRWLQACLALVLVLAAIGCTSESHPSGAATSSSAMPTGGTLHVGICCPTVQQMRRPDFLDPQIPFSIATAQREFLRCCLTRTLMSYTGRSTADGGTVLHPDLALGPPDVAVDGLTWTFHLQSGIHFAPPLAQIEVTAADIVRALQRAVTPSIGTREYVDVYRSIEGVSEYATGRASTISGLETPDPYTLRIHLTEVTNDLGYRLALPGAAPIPAEPTRPNEPFGVATGHDDGYGRFLVSTGPYMIEGAEALDPSLPPAEQRPVAGIVAGRSLTLVRNPSWDRSTDPLRGAFVDRINAEVVDPNEADRMVENGSLDLLLDGQPSPATINRYEADPALRHRIVRERCNYVSFASMRLSDPPFDDVHVRRAANYAFDADRLARLSSRHRWPGLGYYRYLPLTHIAPDSTEAGLLSDWDPYPYDLAKAQAEMSRSRYDRDGDGRCDDDSCQRVLTIDTLYGPEPELDRVWRAAFRAIGISLDIRWLSPGAFAHRQSDPLDPAKLSLGGTWEASFPSPLPLFETAFGSREIGKPDSLNFSLCGASSAQLKLWEYPETSVPSVDEKIASCSRAIATAQPRCWAELDQLLMLQVVPVIPAGGVEEIRVLSDRVTRYSADQPFGAYPALDQITVAASTGV
jgi:ABC-type transport system substrate-binding protein